jgi:E3 ubiquitin-protein ligase HERC4
MQQAMQAAATRAFTQMLFLDGNQHSLANQFIELNVSRDNLVIDTIRELSLYTQYDYKKPLKVRTLILKIKINSR